MNAYPAPFPGEGHDHGRCVSSAVAAAEARCRERGVRLTPIRRRVLELVWTSHEPVGAYAMLGVLKDEGHAAAPPTVYRALDFLLEQGLIHRLERLNAFIGCRWPETPHSAQFLICTGCGRVAELESPEIDRAVAAGAAALGFHIEAQTVEATGLCPDCARLRNHRTPSAES